MKPNEKNRGQEFATMDDEARKKFAQTKEAGGQPGQPRELEFDDPRDPDRMGTDPQSDSIERAEHEETEIAESGAIEEGTRRQPRGKAAPKS